jgi:hypothetical protein
MLSVTISAPQAIAMIAARVHWEADVAAAGFMSSMSGSAVGQGSDGAIVATAAQPPIQYQRAIENERIRHA